MGLTMCSLYALCATPRCGLAVAAAARASQCARSGAQPPLGDVKFWQRQRQLGPLTMCSMPVVPPLGDVV
jgi:hypothetical protein